MHPKGASKGLRSALRLAAIACVSVALLVPASAQFWSPFGGRSQPRPSQQGGFNPFGLAAGAMHELGAQRPSVELDRCIEIRHRHTDMMDLTCAQYVYQPSLVLRPSLPALTLASSSGEGRNRSSPVVLYMCNLAL